ncbi:SGNH/GDSL hydrolase family protein [Chitinophaga sp. SYP-B3965]|uniref:SGNH/GDSL hydrolase family protein n=1 Tax=Chitinophaga sp. SYP-B3965 TaxID=2663120 RepID=UPI001299AAC0|nr:GDSL-type esterase/lipase family protein [Chitinophaga sp. SYP-B3965]MRG43686.1 SGNH/GDSL hydrolase family protein [Chitinophaga sp. SYP-B3965]
MKKIHLICCLLFLSGLVSAQVNREEYLKGIKSELVKEWPKNRTINLVFHGHSVPSGYFKTPQVNTLDAYPQQVLKALKDIYPHAVINVIVTAIGGENSINGEKRFEKDVLIHQPDVLFIDYALNDRGPGLEAAKTAWEKMIRAALAKNIKVILLSPSADLSENILDPNVPLAKFTKQIKEMADAFKVGFVDSYGQFKAVQPVKDYMSQGNHPNKEGHTLIANEIVRWFK